MKKNIFKKYPLLLIKEDMDGIDLKKIRGEFVTKSKDKTKERKTTIIQELRKYVNESTSIKDTSKKTYISRFNTFEDAKYFPPKNTEELFELIKELNPNDNLNTEQNITGQLLIFEKFGTSFKLGKDMLESLVLHHDIISDMKKEKPNEKRESDVSWEQLKDLKPLVRKLKRDERLLYGLYINPGLGFVPRNDFANMKIIDTLEDMEEDKNLNYYVKDIKSVILKEYKTSKRYGRVVTEVPSELIPLIETNQEYVFENGELESISENTLQHKISRFMSKLLGKKFSINNIRRSYATYMENLPITEKAEIARKMGHSLNTNKKKYNYNDDDDIQII